MLVSELLDVLLFVLQLLFLLLQHVGESLDGLLSSLGHLFALLVVKRLDPDSLVLQDRHSLVLSS